MSPTQLTAVIPATNFQSPGVVQVSVANPPVPGGITNSLPFTVTTTPPPCDAPTNPAANSITSNSASISFTASATATNYTVTVTPAGGTATTLTATTSPVALTGLTPGTAYTVSIVSNCTGNTTSAAATTTFTTTAAPNPAPTITSLSPNSATAGGAAFTLTVTGTGFVSGSTVSFNGTTRPTTFVSATQVTAAIPASDIATAGSYNVTVTNAAPGGGTSAPAVFTVNPVVVNNPAPTITSLSPATVTAGAAAQTLTVNGTNFLASSTVSFNGTSRSTTFVSATQLTIALTAADQATAGSYNVTVTNPAPGGGTSAPAVFTVNPAPVACLAPTGLSVSGITSNSATVSFTTDGTTDFYTLTLTPTGGGTPQVYFVVGGINLTGLIASTSYTASIVRNCGSSATSLAVTVSFTTTAAPLTDLVVSSPQPVSGSYNNVTITGTGVATLTGTLTVNGTLTVQSGGALVQACQVIDGPGSFVLLPGANLAICDPAGIATTGAVGAVRVTGSRSFSIDANYAYNGTVAQVTGPGLPSRVLNLGVSNATGLSLSQALSVTQVLRLENGNLATTGQSLTLLSSAAGTALVDNRGGVVVGTATVQRYIDPSRNGGVGYRHYSAPVANTTVADLNTAGFTPIVNPAYNTAGVPNNVSPFPNVFGYDEVRVNTSGGAGSIDFDKGFFSPASTADPMEVTRGYTVNIPAQANVDFVGTLNNGTIAASNLTRGSQAESGWHLRGNPYPSPLNWNLVGKTGVENALYVFKSSGQYTGSYASYINFVGVNGGTNILPVAQGFFVRAAAGQAGSLSFTNAARVNTPDATPFQRGTADTRPRLTLGLTSAAASTQALAYFEPGATAGFDAAFDAHALPAPNGLTLAFETAAAEPLAISGLPALTGADLTLPLRVAARTAGTYALTVDQVRNLPANYRAYLRDALTGTFTDLAANRSVSLDLAANAAAGGRYAVLFTTQARVLGTAPAALARLASVYPNPARGAATLLVPAALRGTQATAVTVVDNLGRVVLARTLGAGATETLELPLAGLAPGVYAVLARTAHGLVAKRLVVE
ncbi:fibronectin type III domain-containing protein [Hymenobacter arizonensis]|uniref:fibronectin type III domain-containing protein n=1 Tax=Hymenobacter arizonensis TaxID=1227077 RepID=UPI001F40D344|nr:fibronectin type III domain-containing protein [Hymenobacter arizonensis]